MLRTRPNVPVFLNFSMKKHKATDQLSGKDLWKSPDQYPNLYGGSGLDSEQSRKPKY